MGTYWNWKSKSFLNRKYKWRAMEQNHKKYDQVMKKWGKMVIYKEIKNLNKENKILKMEKREKFKNFKKETFIKNRKNMKI